MNAGQDRAAGRVVVVGSANVDLVVDVPRHPAGGETILGGDLRRTPGGKGANQAVAAARAGGADTTFVGALGHDESAELLLSSLTGAGVRIDTVARVDAPTGTALITVSPDGENAIVVAPGANSRVRLGATQLGRIAAADVVLAQLEVPLDTVIAAARARREGALFVLNAAPSRELPEELWDEIDVLVVNEHEAEDLVPGLKPRPPRGPVSRFKPHYPEFSAAEARMRARYAETLEGRAQLLAERVPAAVITLGGKGSLVTEYGALAVRVPAAQVTPVETTGAGDTYCGVLAAALARGEQLADAARVAGAAGALAVTRSGAQDAVPDAADVAALAGKLPGNLPAPAPLSIDRSTPKPAEEP